MGERQTCWERKWASSENKGFKSTLKWQAWGCTCWRTALPHGEEVERRVFQNWLGCTTWLQEVEEENRCTPDPDPQADGGRQGQEWEGAAIWRVPKKTPLGFPSDSDSQESACSAGQPHSVSRMGRFPGERNGSALQHSCLGNLMNRGAWRATVHRASKSWTWLSDSHFHLQKIPPAKHLSIERLLFVFVSSLPLLFLVSALNVDKPGKLPLWL